MKTTHITAVGAILALAGVASAANVAFDNASAYAYDSGWTTGSNGGYGWGAWTLVASTGGGFFVGNATGNADGLDNGNVGGIPFDDDINTKTGPNPDFSGSPAPNLTVSRSLGLYAGPFEFAQGTRSFTGGPLAVGQTVTIDFDNGFIDPSARVGISFLNASDQTLFETLFVGGSSNYSFIDGSGFNNWTVPYGDEGLNLTFTLLAPGAYGARLARRDLVSQVISGPLALLPDQNVAKIRVYNFGAGAGSTRDFFVNSMEVIPEPSSGLLALSALGLLHRRRRR